MIAGSGRKDSKTESCGCTSINGLTGERLPWAFTLTPPTGIAQGKFSGGDGDVGNQSLRVAFRRFDGGRPGFRPGGRGQNLRRLLPPEKRLPEPEDPQDPLEPGGLSAPGSQ